MNLDIADLAVLETDIENLEPLGRDVARLLLAEIRRRDDEEDKTTKALELAVDDAKDARKILSNLRKALDKVEGETGHVDDLADSVETALDRIIDP